MEHAGTALIDPAIIFAKIGLESGMRVADLGCGRTGHFIFSAARRVGETGVVYAIDIIKDIVEGIKSRAQAGGYTNIQALWSNIELEGFTPIPSQSLDVCFLINVLFLTADKRSAIAEANRLLKRGGRLLIVEWREPIGLVGPPPERLVSVDSLVQLVGEFPFTLFEQFSAGPYHTALLFTKL